MTRAMPATPADAPLSSMPDRSCWWMEPIACLARRCRRCGRIWEAEERSFGFSTVMVVLGTTMTVQGGRLASLPQQRLAGRHELLHRAGEGVDLRVGDRQHQGDEAAAGVELAGGDEVEVHQVL